MKEVQTQERVASPEKPSVVIATNLIREREMYDKNGNLIDPITKQIIKLAKDL